MSVQKVDTECIGRAADKLNSVNNTINTKFDDLKRNMQTLERDWKSEAGSSAVTKMYDVARGNEIRSTTIDNFHTVLKQKIQPDEVSAEMLNVRLADLFK